MMVRNVSLLAACLAIGAPGHAWCQTIGAPQIQSGRPASFPAPGLESLRQALGLTEAQVRQLQDLQRTRQVRSQALYQEIAAKQKQLNDMLNADNADALALGQLEIQMVKLRKQAAPAPIKDEALAVLTDAQRAKLADLQNALNLQPAASDALRLGLIEAPRPLVPFGLRQ